jgi:hypothetical protein
MNDMIGKQIADDYIEHFGINGMKWGIRRTREFLAKLAGRYSANRKARAVARVEKAGPNANRKRLSEIDDETLKRVIARLKLEQEYKTLAASAEVATGKGLARKILEASAADLAKKFIEGSGAKLGSYAADKFTKPKQAELDAALQDEANRTKYENERRDAARRAKGAKEDAEDAEKKAKKEAKKAAKKK